MPGVHSRLAPSAASEWSNCPARARAQAPEKPPTEATIKGNRGHARVAHLIRTGEPFKVRESQDVIVFVGHARKERDSNPLALMVVETTLQSLTIPDLFGTPDVLFVAESYMQVIDLKTGRWAVNAKNNPQLMTYLYLAIDNFGPRDMYFGEIVQYGRVQTAMWTHAQMEEWAETVKWAADNPQIYNAGDHCRFCPWRKTCQLGTQYAKDHDRNWD